MARTVGGIVWPKTSSAGTVGKMKTLPNKFEGLVISASGKIPDYEHDEIQKMVEECGAKFEKMKVGDCTHLITTPECYHSEKAPAKITEAQQNPNCDIVSIDWLLASLKKKEPLNTRGFLIKALGSKRLVPATTDGNASSKPTSNLKRKPTTDSSSAEIRRAKIAKNNVLANRDKLSALVDQGSHDEADRNNLLVWIDEEDVIRDATLVEESPASDKQSKSGKTSTSAKLTRIQLILDIKADKYYTFIRETTMTRQQTAGLPQSGSVKSAVSRKGNGQLSRAITEFETAFEQLTGLAWGQRSKQPKEGKAKFLQLESKNDQGKLDSAVCDVLGKLVPLQNFAAAKATLLELWTTKLLENTEKNVDHSLHTAIALLEKLSKVQDSGGTKTQGLTASLKQCFFELFWPAGKRLPKDAQWISRSHRLIQDLRDCRAIEAAPKNLGQPDPIVMRHVLGLLHLKAMTRVKTGTDEYKVLAEYFKESSGMHSVTIVNVFQLEREGEAEQFAKWRNKHKSALSTRRLLWHGSAIASFASILRHGFRIGPSRGIFFADWSEKSIGFCRIARGQEAFMLLCEVEFGRQGGAFGGRRRDANSYIYNGVSHQTWNDAASAHPNLKGVKIPVVKALRSAYVFTKEYVIMDQAQIRQRYLFHFRLN